MTSVDLNGTTYTIHDDGIVTAEDREIGLLTERLGATSSMMRYRVEDDHYGFTGYGSTPADALDDLLHMVESEHRFEESDEAALRRSLSLRND